MLAKIEKLGMHYYEDPQNNSYTTKILHLTTPTLPNTNK
jgi:hypothetical protein